MDDAGLLESTNWDTKDKEFVFYCPEIKSLVVDGISRDTSDDADYRFEELQLIGTDFEVQTSRPGTVSLFNHRLAINITGTASH